jgi:hypothetical protein
MRFVAVKFGDSECLILRMPSLRKIWCYSVLVFVRNEVSAGKVSWTGNVHVRCSATSSCRNFCIAVTAVQKALRWINGHKRGLG